MTTSSTNPISNNAICGEWAQTSEEWLNGNALNNTVACIHAAEKRRVYDEDGKEGLQGGYRGRPDPDHDDVDLDEGWPKARPRRAHPMPHFFTFKDPFEVFASFFGSAHPFARGVCDAGA